MTKHKMSKKEKNRIICEVINELFPTVTSIKKVSNKYSVLLTPFIMMQIKFLLHDYFNEGGLILLDRTTEKTSSKKKA